MQHETIAGNNAGKLLRWILSPGILLLLAACEGTPKNPDGQDEKSSPPKGWAPVRRGATFLGGNVVAEEVAIRKRGRLLSYAITLRNKDAKETRALARAIFLNKDGTRLIYVAGIEYRTIRLRPGKNVVLEGLAPGPETTNIALDLRAR